MMLLLVLSPDFLQNAELQIKKNIYEQYPLICDEEFENIKNNNSKNLCGICLVTRAKNKTLKCKHTFCKKCIEKWLKCKSRTCPNCRKKI